MEDDVIEGVPGRIDDAECEMANAEVAVECEVPIVGNVSCRMGVDGRTGSAQATRPRGA